MVFAWQPGSAPSCNARSSCKYLLRNLAEKHFSRKKTYDDERPAHSLPNSLSPPLHLSLSPLPQATMPYTLTGLRQRESNGFRYLGVFLGWDNRTLHPGRGLSRLMKSGEHLGSEPPDSPRADSALRPSGCPTVTILLPQNL